MPVLIDISMLATCRDAGRQREIHVVEDAALVWREDVIEWAGPRSELPKMYAEEPVESAGWRLVIPGLVDCHTHLCFGGWRGDEFARRIRGESYLDIARAGGGIASTVKHTREASQEELEDRGQYFLAEIRKLGVTTVEAKSGYGLSVEDELKTLRAYKMLMDSQPTRLKSTFLGAHIVPPEFKENREEYIRILTEELIPQIAADGLASFCDVFVEDTAYSADEARHILEVAHRHGLRAKLHVDQLSDSYGGRLAADVEAISADHLEYSNDDSIRAMAASGTIAVALPLATLYLNVDPMPARRFINAGVPVAVATDFNPGSAPSYDLPLAMLLSCTMLRMEPAEVLKGATIYAARAIGMEEKVGSLEAGKKADFAIIDSPDVNHWLYHFRPNACIRTVMNGETVWLNDHV